ncbi:hypothetical protein BC829DRAFT_419790 [Chytridium lagenaria]|nr:hypothetical protein BC829DRAFT_419790 [Chytridium lagenaria]
MPKSHPSVWKVVICKRFSALDPREARGNIAVTTYWILLKLISYGTVSTKVRVVSLNKVELINSRSFLIILIGVQSSIAGISDVYNKKDEVYMEHTQHILGRGQALLEMLLHKHYKSKSSLKSRHNHSMTFRELVDALTCFGYQRHDNNASLSLPFWIRRNLFKDLANGSLVIGQDIGLHPHDVFRLNIIMSPNALDTLQNPLNDILLVLQVPSTLAQTPPLPAPCRALLFVKTRPRSRSSTNIAPKSDSSRFRQRIETRHTPLHNYYAVLEEKVMRRRKVMMRAVILSGRRDDREPGARICRCEGWRSWCGVGLSDWIHEVKLLSMTGLPGEGRVQQKTGKRRLRFDDEGQVKKGGEKDVFYSHLKLPLMSTDPKSYKKGMKSRALFDPFDNPSSATKDFVNKLHRYGLEAAKVMRLGKFVLNCFAKVFIAAEDVLISEFPAQVLFVPKDILLPPPSISLDTCNYSQSFLASMFSTLRLNVPEDSLSSSDSSSDSNSESDCAEKGITGAEKDDVMGGLDEGEGGGEDLMEGVEGMEGERKGQKPQTFFKVTVDGESYFLNVDIAKDVWRPYGNFEGVRAIIRLLNHIFRKPREF